MKKIKLDKLKFRDYVKVNEGVLNNSSLVIGQDGDDFAHELVTMMLQTFVYGRETVQEVKTGYQVPETPWQHFKEAYFPKWMLRFFPVRYRYKAMTIKVNCKQYFPEIPAGEPHYHVIVIEE